MKEDTTARMAPNHVLRFLPSLEPDSHQSPGRLGMIPEPLDRSAVTFYPKARNAIWHMAKALNLRPGQNVLMPAYHCGSELDALLKADVSARFYRVGRTARLDPEDIEKRIDPNTRVIYVIHYFGFAQPLIDDIADLCARRGLYLLEDCAHALYSTRRGRPLGTFGDASVFSLWKTLPVKRGGALLINNPSLVALGPTMSSPLDPDTGETRRAPQFLSDALRLSSRILGRARKSIPRLIRNRSHRVLSEDDPGATGPNPRVTLDLRTIEWGMPSAEMDMLRRIDHERIPVRRRLNYRHLYRRLSERMNLHPLTPAPTEDDSPLCLPLLTDRADELRSFLRQNGIMAERFWIDLHERSLISDFPEAVELRAKTIALPVHQDLDASDLDRIADTLLQGLGR